LPGLPCLLLESMKDVDRLFELRDIDHSECTGIIPQAKLVRTRSDAR
jgi:hypothetical protein